MRGDVGNTATWFWFPTPPRFPAFPDACTVPVQAPKHPLQAISGPGRAVHYIMPLVPFGSGSNAHPHARSRTHAQWEMSRVEDALVCFCVMLVLVIIVAATHACLHRANKQCAAGGPGRVPGVWRFRIGLLAGGAWPGRPLARLPVTRCRKGGTMKKMKAQACRCARGEGGGVFRARARALRLIAAIIFPLICTDDAARVLL